MNPATQKLNDFISLQIYPQNIEAATAIKVAIDQQQGISDVRLSEDLHTLACKYDGTYAGLSKLEQISSGFLTNPAKMILGLSKNYSGQKCKSCGVQQHLQGVPGVKFATVNGSVAEMYADLATFEFEKLVEEAQSAGYTAELRSHERFILRFEGDSSNMTQALKAIRGVLKVDIAAPEAKIVVVKGVSPTTLKSTAEKTGAKITTVSR